MIAVFDIDGTLRRVTDPWLHLHRHLGTADKGEEFYRRYLAGEITYAEMARLDVSTWKGVPLRCMMQCLESNPFREGADRLVQWFRSQSIPCVGISTGLSIFNATAKTTLGLDEVICNNPEFVDGICTGNVTVNVEERGKGTVLRQVLRRYATDKKEVCVFGDSQADIAMFEMALVAVAVFPRTDDVAGSADLVVNTEPIDHICKKLALMLENKAAITKESMRRRTRAHDSGVWARQMKAIAFDLGDTLVEYEGLPLSWEAHYPEAIGNLATFLGLTTDSDRLAQACAVLRRYNTRINPREEEVSFARILGEMMNSLDATVEADEVACATCFFRIFRQRLRCCSDARAAVDSLRRMNLKIGVFTDVPYGMPRQLVLEDVRGAGLEYSFDVLMTSRDAGFRKPSVETLGALAKMLNCSAHEMAYVGNEKKDVDVALAFGCRSILIDRERHCSDWGQHRTITSLTELTEVQHHLR